MNFKRNQVLMHTKNGQTLGILILKEEIHKMPHILLFHLYEMPRQSDL